ncbi:Rieske (2Fe-2S) protein [Emcibacter nanhaiensis]|uniref:Rieske 2Fe-2S domain-containing protein n=1 Tax=Emcibacter nanhaiensis TaxID=1505037 RepID=A0A501PN06_9PROT|nr:Rieske 2Fe-2S domain-containing protein [Emcibacter nanhaiensis]TPD61467.1 Rieske 2Fe-2S domain-containing protein [Emcibacter nanhaiensis]
MSDVKEFDIYLRDVANGPGAGAVLCALADIEDGKGREFRYGTDKEPFEFFVYRRGGEIFAYQNACPHMYVPLNLKEGVFTEKSGQYFLCNFHGALFQVEDGLCMAGPCRGRSLQSVAVGLEDGRIIVL